MCNLKRPFFFGIYLKSRVKVGFERVIMQYTMTKGMNRTNSHLINNTDQKLGSSLYF